MRVAFLGTPDPAVPSLMALLAADDADVPVVITNPDRPRDRGHSMSAPPVKRAALDAGVDVWQPDTPREIAAALADLRCDAAAVVAYGALLPADVLATTRHGFVNLHFSVLPAWRGAAPVPHAIRAGDATTGVTCFVLDEGMDTGPVLSVATEPILDDDTAGSLTARLAERGAQLLVESVRGLVDGSLTPTPQPAEGVSHAPKLASDDARLDWSEPAETLERAVRAFDPVPGAHTTLGPRRVKVLRAAVAEDVDAAASEPGTVVRGDADGPVVVCGDRRGLRLLEVQPAGKARMDGAAFANGYRPHGMRLGT